MKFGDELTLKLVDGMGRSLYEEPFELTEYSALRNFEDAVAIFQENGHDAVRMLVRDIDVSKKLKEFGDGELIAALRIRGYQTPKKGDDRP